MCAYQTSESRKREIKNLLRKKMRKIEKNKVRKANKKDYSKERYRERQYEIDKH